MNNTPYDKNPTCGNAPNFASNIGANGSEIQKIIDAFNYGFRLGWQTHWEEVEELKLLTQSQ